ncbi:uncharacterized protein LOC135478121 [Liolophura sinensis]|uniref:uncharacterized protein LOC135478121 n=1 Tax=Liolophura sinensis TaxID=3198878 RepID=UPI0031582B0B
MASYLGVDILLVKGTVDANLKLLLESGGIVVVEHIQYRLLTVLAEKDMSKLVTYVESCSREDLCCLNVSTLELADDNLKNFFVLKPVDRSNMMWTVVLSHPCEDEACRREQQVWKCAACLSSVLQGHGVIPGEGQSELQLARWLSAGDTQPPYADDNILKSLVFEELAAGFREYHSLVLRNAGILHGTERKDYPSCFCGHFAKSEKPNSSVNKQEYQDCQFSSHCTYTQPGQFSSDKSCMEGWNDQYVNNAFLESVRDLRNSDQLLCPNCGLSQPSIVNPNHPYLDDFVSKARAYQSALETVCLILQCDYHITTGISAHCGPEVKTVL